MAYGLINGNLVLASGTLDGSEDAGGGGPWDAPDDTEVFNDNLSGSYNGSWNVYSGTDTSTTPSIDSTVGTFRAKAANPVIDVTTDSNALLIQPAHTASVTLSMAIDLDAQGLDFTDDWTIVSKISLPDAENMGDNNLTAAIGASLPGGANSLLHNSIILYAAETDEPAAVEVDYQYDRYDDGTPNSTEWGDRNILVTPGTYLLKLIHVNADNDTYCQLSKTNGYSWTNLGAFGKNPDAFTTGFIHLGWTKDASDIAEAFFRVHYFRAYQSVKER